MRILILAAALFLAACSSGPSNTSAGTNLTVGVEQCSKHGWGTGAMAQCADAARASQQGHPVGAGTAAPAAAPSAPPSRAWPWNWFG